MDFQDELCIEVTKYTKCKSRDRRKSKNSG